MYIAIDVGGTNIRVAGFKTLGKELPETLKFKTSNNYEEDIKNIFDAIVSFAKKPLAIGMALKGPIDNGRTISLSKKLGGWENKTLKKDFNKKFDCPFYLDNDAALASLGEHSYGSKYNDFLFIIWGTGTGGAVFSYGHYKNLEPGTTIQIDGEELESYTGSAAIRKRYNKTPDLLNDAEWSEVTNNFSKGLNVILDQHPTNHIIFGGGVAINHPDKIFEIEKLVNAAHERKVEFEITELKDSAGLYGSLALIKKNQQ